MSNKERRSIVEAFDEVKECLEYAGRTVGTEVKDRHLIVTMNYMAMTKTEEWEKTRSKLRLVLCIDERYIQQIMNSIANWGFVELTVGRQSQIWRWIGVPK